jgi:hypothetical protein
MFWNRLTRRLLFVHLPFLTVFFLFAFNFAIKPIKAQSAVNEQYAVYSALLNEVYYLRKVKNLPVTLLLIQNNTKHLLMDLEEEKWEGKRVKKNSIAYSPQFQEAVEDYKSKKEPQIIENSLKSEADYLLIKQEELDSLLKRDNSVFKDWEAFQRKFPKSDGYYVFSRVGFNSEKTHAFVYVSFACGDMCGKGSYKLLIKENGVWKVKETIHLFVA